MGQALVQAWHFLHLFLSPCILYNANLEPILSKVVIGQRYLQKARLSFKAKARIIPDAK